MLESSASSLELCRNGEVDMRIKGLQLDTVPSVGYTAPGSLGCSRHCVATRPDLTGSADDPPSTIY